MKHSIDLSAESHFLVTIKSYVRFFYQCVLSYASNMFQSEKLNINNYSDTPFSFYLYRQTQKHIQNLHKKNQFRKY